MSKLRDLIKSPHIQVALTTGFSIIVMAYVSKRILPEPIGYLPLALPPFIMVIFESVYSRDKDSKFCQTWYWVTAILVSTLIVIVS